MDILEKYANGLAHELLETNLMDIEDVKRKCKTYIRMAYRDLNDAALGEHNIKFIELIERQQKLKLNSPDYVKCGYEMAKLKPLRAAANAAVNNMKREDRVTELEISLKRIYDERDYWKELLKQQAPVTYDAVISKFVDA